MFEEKQDSRIEGNNCFVYKIITCPIMANILDIYSNLEKWIVVLTNSNLCKDMVFMQRTSCDRKHAILRDDVIMNYELWWANFCESNICKVFYELSSDPRSRWRSKISQGKKKIIVNCLFEKCSLLVVEITCFNSGLFLHTLYYNPNRVGIS